MVIGNLLLVALFASPATVTAPPPGAPLPAGWGACDYTTADSQAKGLSMCTHVEDLAHCTATATSRSSQDWIAAHPPRFTADVRCDAQAKSAGTKKAKSKAAAKDAGLPRAAQ